MLKLRFINSLYLGASRRDSTPSFSYVHFYWLPFKLTAKTVFEDSKARQHLTKSIYSTTFSPWKPIARVNQLVVSICLYKGNESYEYSNLDLKQRLEIHREINLRKIDHRKSEYESIQVSSASILNSYQASWQWSSSFPSG